MCDLRSSRAGTVHVETRRVGSFCRTTRAIKCFVREAKLLNFNFKLFSTTTTASTPPHLNMSAAPEVSEEQRVKAIRIKRVLAAVQKEMGKVGEVLARDTAFALARRLVSTQVRRKAS